MTWDELPDGQNIEALDNIRLYSIKPIAIDEGEGVYISDTQNKFPWEEGFEEEFMEDALCLFDEKHSIS